MTPDVFAEWLRRQGYRVARTESSYWFEQGPRVYQAFPYHWVITPSEKELRKLLWDQRAIGLRYSTPIDAPQGRVSYHAVFEEPVYSLEGLDRRARQNARRGLNHCTVAPISLSRLAEEGWALHHDTVDRQGRKDGLTEEGWRARYLAAEGLPGFEAWGALVQDRLAAAIFLFQMGDCCTMLHQQSHRDFLPLSVNNALTFAVTETMTNRPDIRSIFYALHSLDAPANVDEFKFRMGYTAKPVRQRVVFHPWLSPAFGQTGLALVGRLRRQRPEAAFLSKAEGMIRFHIDGKRPLADQEWPEPLAEKREGASAARVTSDEEPASEPAAEGPRPDPD